LPRFSEGRSLDLSLANQVSKQRSVLKVVEKGIGISYPIGKQTTEREDMPMKKGNHKGQELAVSELGLSLE
jgi:hypothetical protein